MKKYVRPTNHKWEPEPEENELDNAEELDFDYQDLRQIEKIEERTRAGVLFVIMFIIILLIILYKVII